MNNDILQAKGETNTGSQRVQEAYNALTEENVDKAEVALLEAINALTSALVHLRNYRVT